MKSHREVRPGLDPFAIIFPKIAPRHKLSSQQDDDDRAQEELHYTPEPNLDFRSRVRFLRSNHLPSREPFVSLVFAYKPFVVLLPLLVPIFFVPDHNKRKFKSPLEMEIDGVESVEGINRFRFHEPTRP